MATEDDGLISDFLDKRRDMSGHLLQCILLGRLRGRCPAVAQHVRHDNLQVQGQKIRDLITPSHTKVWPVVNDSVSDRLVNWLSHADGGEWTYQP